MFSSKPFFRSAFVWSFGLRLLLNFPVSRAKLGTIVLAPYGYYNVCTTGVYVAPLKPRKYVVSFIETESPIIVVFEVDNIASVTQVSIESVNMFVSLIVLML